MNDFVAIYNDINVNVGDTVWSSLDILWAGATVFLSVEICNVFSFELRAMRLQTDASFQDLDGVNSWFLPYSGPGQEEVTLAEGVVWQSYEQSDGSRPDDLVIPPGECKFTPEIQIDVPVDGEMVSRIYDEAVSKGRLCISIRNMILDVGLTAGKENSAMFQWTQPLDLRKISVRGTSDCVEVPDCTNVKGPVLVQEFDAAQWQVNGATIQDTASMKMNTDDQQENSAFLLNR